jgi:protocatechuate 3,4-dioxygenase beta subunit
MIVEDGQFHMEKIGPGEYRAELTRLPDGYAVTDLLLGNVSTQGHALVLSGGSELTFVVTSKPGMITGTIRDKNQAPLKGAEVVLIPLQSDDPELWRRTASGEGGAFSFRNLPPGKYRIEGGAEVEVKAAEQAGVDVVR